MASNPARFTSALLPEIDRLLGDYSGVFLDPFAGSGKGLTLARPGRYVIGVDIEPDWDACYEPGPHCEMRQGNAKRLSFYDNYFDGAFTSPSYGNRMADHFVDGKGVADAQRCRNTYTHRMGRPLHPDNSGMLQWGSAYRQFHIVAWTELRRVLKPGAVFVLNTKDHIRNGQPQPVTRWHCETLCALGFVEFDRVQVATPSNRRGANGGARIAHESLIKFVLDKRHVADWGEVWDA